MLNGYLLLILGLLKLIMLSLNVFLNQNKIFGSEQDYFYSLQKVTSQSFIVAIAPQLQPTLITLL